MNKSRAYTELSDKPFTNMVSSHSTHLERSGYLFHFKDEEAEAPMVQ